MKIKVFFNTPDAVDEALAKDYMSEEDNQEAKNFIKKFVKYDECVTIEFDTEANTATVLPVK